MFKVNDIIYIKHLVRPGHSTEFIYRAKIGDMGKIIAISPGDVSLYFVNFKCKNEWMSEIEIRKETILEKIMKKFGV